MTRGGLEGYLPSEWAEAYEPLALLKEGAQRQTLLLRERAGEPGRLAVLKREAGDGRHLQSEYELMKALAGPGVPVVYALLTCGGATYLLREYVDGETLLDYMQKHPKLSSREAAEIGIQVCRVLRRLHAQQPPVVHRDVKAENIVRRRDGSCALIDFGIARRQRGAAERDTELLGTPGIAPPEQFGLRQTAPSADVYALGVLLRELSTGDLDREQGKPPALLRRVIRRCTAVDPAKRYRDAAELERALRLIARRRALACLACACLAAAALLAGCLLPGEGAAPGDATLYAFASPAIEAEVCRQLGREPGSVTRGDLASVHRLLLVGDVPFEDWSQLMAYGKEVQLDHQSVYAIGDIDTLADIPNLPNLRDLALCRQQIADLTPLSGCALQRLAICGNEVADLSPLSSCTQLQELFLSDNPIEDLSPLSSCANLWKINLGATLVSSLDDLEKLPGLIYVESHDSWQLRDISALERLPKLWHLSLRPVRPGFSEVIGKLAGLENLYLWYLEERADLAQLSGLAQLRRLFIHARYLPSLEGVRPLKRLNFLEVYSDAPLDLRPLSGLGDLEELWVAHLHTDDWTPLASLPSLKRLYCSPTQAAEIRRQLDGEDWSAEIIASG